MRIRSQSDFWCGLLFVAVGIAVMVLARNHRMGTAARMGPAFFPTLLGGLMIFLGLTLALPALFKDGEKLPRLHLRSFAMVLLGVVAFGIALEYLGFAIAVAVLVIVSGLAEPELRWREAAALALFLVVFSVGVFVSLLGIPLPVLPDF